MDLKELKKLINEEIIKNKLLEATDPGTPRAKIKAAQKSLSVDPNAPTVIKQTFQKDPAKQPSVSIQPKAQEMKEPQEMYKGILRLHNALRDKFDLEMGNQEVYEIIREITSQEIEKLRKQFPEMDIGSKLG